LAKKRGRRRAGAREKREQPVGEVYRTPLGRMLLGQIEDALSSPRFERIQGKVSLVFTSPPFPLVSKKRYGNKTGQAYVQWLKALAPKLCKLLKPDGSIVIELGNAWVRGSPVMSTLPLEALLAFKKAGRLQLCQHIICHNPARLPGPAAWVNVERIRLKDSYTHVWWMSRSAKPKADNRRVLTPYIYTLVATGPEITRLREEEKELESVTDVSWSRT